LQYLHGKRTTDCYKSYDCFVDVTSVLQLSKNKSWFAPNGYIEMITIATMPVTGVIAEIQKALSYKMH